MFLILSFLFSLFIVYMLSREDYTLMRKNITLEDMFNLSFLGIAGCLLISRIFFVLFHWKRLYSNPLAFLLIPYFPGLSFPGGILVGMLLLLIISRKRKMPWGRLLDIFTLAAFFGITGYHFLTFIWDLFLNRNHLLSDGVHLIGYIFLFVSCLLLYRSEHWKDGFISSILWIILSLTISIENFIAMKQHFHFFMTEQSLFLIILITSIGILIGSSNLITTAKKH